MEEDREHVNTTGNGEHTDAQEERPEPPTGRSDGADPFRSSVSRAQKEANRKNAQGSTGPRTPKGKANSSMNSLKHGIYSEYNVAVPRGVFAEDPEEFKKRIEEIVQALDPFDAMESEQAHVIAGLYIRLGRLSRLEALALSKDGRAAEKCDEDQFAYEILAGRANRMSLFLTKGVRVRDVNFEVLANFLRDCKGEGKTQLKGLWTENVKPKSEREWRRAFDLLVRHYFGDERAAAAWALKECRDWQRLAEEYVGKSDEISAARALEGSLERTSTIGARLGREHQRAYEFYRRLKIDREMAELKAALKKKEEE